MKTVLARETEQKLQVNQLCVDFQQAVLKPQNVVFDYSDEGCMTLVVMLPGKCPKKTALAQLSQNLTRMAAEAAALAAALPDEPAVTIDESNKAVKDE